MQFNTQKNHDWSFDVMTECKGKWKDYIKDWGCVITCLANILQCQFDMVFTPKDMNRIIKEHDGYWFPFKTRLESQASFLNWTVAENLFKFKMTREKFTVHEEDAYYIARIIVGGQGHYINVISVVKNKYLCFDTFTGELIFVPYKKITGFRKIKFWGEYHGETM